MSERTKFLPLLCGIAVIAGCAHFQPQPLAPEKSAAQFDARRFDDAGLKVFLATNSPGAVPDWPLEKWDLNSLTLAAFYFHPDLAVARAQWRVAEAGEESAGARPNPSVSFSPSYDTQIPNNPSPWIIPVTFDIPIETAGKRGKRVAEAQKAAESARWSFVSAAWQVRSNVRASLLDFSLAKRRADLLQEQFAAQTNIVELLQGQYDAGAIARPDLTLAQIALHKTQLDLSDAQSKKADALSRLAQALGVSLAALDGVNLQFDFSTKSLDDLDTLTSAGARGIALRERADILGALADYAAAEADLQLQIAKQYPDLHLGPGYAWNNGNAGDNQWILGATLELPILDQNQGPIAEAEAQRKLSAAKFLALQAQVCGQIDSAVADVRVAREQLQTGEKLTEAEKQQLKSAEAQVQAGAGERQDVFNAQLESANAALTQLDNEEKLQSAIGALENALQSPADQLAAVIKKISTENVKGSQP
ncbi:MAG TPA: TolC family protein [Verrucomicrobiae bacterium]|jgi:outer membrane protein TolC|nr:TolC family protein [Verrucomicrobiae bacterium]